MQRRFIMLGQATTNPTKDPSPANHAVGGWNLNELFSGQSSLTLINTYLVPAVVVLIVLVLAYFISLWLGRLSRHTVSRSVRDETLGKFAGRLTRYAVMILTLLGVLGYFGISVSAFAAVLAAAGLAIGLAFQGTLSNFAAGMMLLSFRPFRVGHTVNVAAVYGKVVEIELFYTTFDTFDNRRMIIPNRDIFGSVIENVSHHDQRRCDVNVGVAYDASLDQTRQVLCQAAESLGVKMVQGEGRGYQVYLLDLGDSSVNWVVRVWTKAEDFWPVKEQLTSAIKRNLDDASINIPFPQMDVHLDKPTP